MNAKRGVAALGAMAEINITPLVDVLLVLLIIFMVVTPVAQRGLDTALPQPPPDKQTITPALSLVLELNQTGLFLNKAPVASLADLDTRLRSYFETHEDKTLFVRAAGSLSYGRVIEALDVARGAGAGRIGMIGGETGPQPQGRP